MQKPRQGPPLTCCAFILARSPFNLSARPVGSREDERSTLSCSFRRRRSSDIYREGGWARQH